MPTGSNFMVFLHEWLIFYGINVGKHIHTYQWILWDIRATVDGSEIRRSPVEIGSWNLIIYMVLYIQTVLVWYFWTTNSMCMSALCQLQRNPWLSRLVSLRMSSWPNMLMPVLAPRTDAWPSASWRGFVDGFFPCSLRVVSLQECFFDYVDMI